MNYLLVLAGVTFPIPVLTALVMFKSWADFLEAIHYGVTPDIISDLRGEGVDDAWQSLKLWILPLVWVLSAISVHTKWGDSIKQLAESLGG